MELVFTAKKYNSGLTALKVQDGSLKGKTARAFDFDEVKIADPDKDSPLKEYTHTLLIADGVVDLEVDTKRRMEGANVVGASGYKINGRDARTFENGLLTVIDFTSQTDSQYSFVVNHGSGLVELWRD